MKLIDFIDNFEEAENKNDFVQKHIIDTYIPLAIKIAKCEKLVELSNIHEVEGKKIYKKNSIYQVEGKKIYKKNSIYQDTLFVLDMIQTYTDIEFDISTEPTVVYDMFCESGALAYIEAYLPKSELSEWKRIINSSIKDFEDNYRTLPSWLDSKFEGLQFIMDDIINRIESKIDVDDIKDYLKELNK